MISFKYCISLVFIYITIAEVSSRCVLILDVRSEFEINLYGKVNCALNLPVHNDASLIDDIKCLTEYDTSWPIEVYCAAGARAQTAVNVLQNSGFTDGE